jgi:membrane protease YdiL (CAAX protease family)
MTELRRAKWKVCLFLLFVAVFAAFIAVLRVVVPSGSRLLFVTWSPFVADAFEMWSVGAAGLIALFIIDGSFADVGWRPPRPRYLMVALILPAIYCCATYVPVWLTGIGSFRGAPYFTLRVLKALLYLPVSCLFAAGEEIGWRGVLVPNLSLTCRPITTALLPGAVWAAWHYPDIVFFGYNVGTPPPYAMTCFTITLIGFGAFLSWLRLASHSVWPAVVFHGAGNALMGRVFDASTQADRVTDYITTEFGIGLSIASALIGYASWIAYRKLPSSRLVA